MECKLPHPIPPGAWLGHLWAGCKAAGGEGDDPELALELDMVGGTTVGWGAGGWDPRVKATKKPVQAPGLQLWEAQPEVFVALLGSGRVGGLCAQQRSFSEIGNQWAFYKGAQLLPCPSLIL